MSKHYIIDGNTERVYMVDCRGELIGFDLGTGAVSGMSMPNPQTIGHLWWKKTVDYGRRLTADEVKLLLSSKRATPVSVRISEVRG